MPTLPRSVLRAALAACALVLLASGPARAWDFPADAIADRAEAHANGYGGQCKVFAQRVVNEVLARHDIRARIHGYGTPGGAYYGAYERAGGILVDPRAGQRGDVIQVITPSQKRKDFPDTRDDNNESILHTAIILEAIEPGVYRVRDSNYVGWETIGSHRWHPLEWRERGVAVYVWRFGQAPDPVVMPSGYIAAGVTARAHTLPA